MPDTVLDAGDTVVNKAGQVPAPKELILSKLSHPSSTFDPIEGNSLLSHL